MNMFLQYLKLLPSRLWQGLFEGLEECGRCSAEANMMMEGYTDFEIEQELGPRKKIQDPEA